MCPLHNILFTVVFVLDPQCHKTGSLLYCMLFLDNICSPEPNRAGSSISDLIYYVTSLESASGAAVSITEVGVQPSSRLEQKALSCGDLSSTDNLHSDGRARGHVR